MEVPVSVKELLEAGVHFGHQTRRWNPKMKPYIFEERNGIYIIDLQQSVAQLQKACEYAQETAARGGTFLFVGTKKQAQESIKQSAIHCQAYYVTERWLGGTLTNLRTIRKSIQRLLDLDEVMKEDSVKKLSKKEASSLRRERNKLHKHLEGIKAMEKLPSCIFVVDTKREEIAIAEARKLKVPVVAILDTNCDPDEVDYPIAGNDDAIKSIRLIVEKIAEAINLGRQSQPKEIKPAETEKEEEKVPVKEEKEEKEEKEKAPVKEEDEKTEELIEKKEDEKVAAVTEEKAVRVAKKTTKTTKAPKTTKKK